MRRLLIILLMFAGVARATVLTFTANNVTVHRGDEVPPLTWINSGFAGTDTWSSAVINGYPTCTTTYTSSSAIGTYPVTCTAGNLVANGSYTFSFVPGTITVEAATGMGAAVFSEPVQPSGMMQNMTVANSSCNGLVGNGTTDNTAVFNCFLNTNRSAGCKTYGAAPKQFYLPTGVYLVSGTLNFCGSAIAISGDGWNKSVIKLASASPGFNAPGTPAAIVYFPGGTASGANNNGFNEHFENIGVEVGPGNSGARGVQFTGNNFDAVRNVKVWFDDSQGDSAFNVDRAWPGQTLFKNIAGYGGSYCFKATLEVEYNSVIYNLTCENQTVGGIIGGGYTIATSNYFSVNSVPAWTNTSAADVLLGAELIRGGAANTAITNGSSGTFYARNITESGYLHTIVDSNGGTTTNGAITEHWSGTAQSLFTSGAATGIIIPNPPDSPVASDPAPSTWCALGPDPTTWTATLSGCASTTAYVPVSCNYPSNTTNCSNIANMTGYYTPTTTAISVTVPGNINHIRGNNYAMGTGVFITWIIGGSSANPPLIIDHINSTVTAPVIAHNSSRTLVLEDSGFDYNCTSGAGNLFFEDAQLEYVVPTSFCTGQSIYARGLDDEIDGANFGVSSVGYVSATHTLTLTLAIDSSMKVGSSIYFGAATNIVPATWLDSTAAVVTGISGTTVTATWAGTEADYPVTAQTAGHYAVQPDKVVATGINLWVMGWKSERPGTDLNITNGNVEVDGFFQYPLHHTPPGWAAFKFTDTNYFLTGESYFGGGSQNQYFATETRSGVTNSLTNPAYGTSNNANLNMLYSIGAGPSGSGYPVTDAFSGSGALSASWTNTTSSSYVALAQASGTAVPSVSGKQGLAIYTGVTFTSDQYSQVKFVTHTSLNDSTGPCVRMNAAGSGICWIADSGQIYRLFAGSGTHRVAYCAIPASGDTLQLSVVGTTYTCTDVTTGVHASGTDSTYSSGNPGILVDQRTATSYALTQFQGDCVPSCAGSATATTPIMGVIKPVMQSKTVTTPAVQSDRSHQTPDTVSNTESSTSQDVVLTGVLLASASRIPVSQPFGSIAPIGYVTGGSNAARGGVSGAAAIATIRGTYTGGMFGGSIPAKLP
jgi:MBG domain (YGX type)